MELFCPVCESSNVRETKDHLWKCKDCKWTGDEEKLLFDVNQLPDFQTVTVKTWTPNGFREEGQFQIDNREFKKERG